MKFIQLFSHKSEQINIMYLLCIIILLTILFLFLQPKIASNLFYERRLQIRDEFLKKIIRDDSVDPKIFWEFREFYNPGVYNFKLKTLDSSNIPEDLKNLLPEGNYYIYLSFTSGKIKSVDIVGGGFEYHTVLKKVKNISGAKILTEADDKLLVTDDKSYYLVFYKPQEAFHNTSGIFSYWNLPVRDEDKDWINLTKINL